MTDSAVLLLLADSQLLFRPDLLPQLQQRCRAGAVGNTVTAAYIGAANGHQSAFYELACSALDAISGAPVPCHFIRSVADIPAHAVDIVILAGGSVRAGWEFLQQPRIKHWLEACYRQTDAVLVGVSAGAIHLGSGCDPEMPLPQAQTYLGWAPVFVAAHEEKAGWPSQAIWQAGDVAVDFCGLPLGGGCWIEQGRAVPVGKGVVSVRRQP